MNTARNDEKVKALWLGICHRNDAAAYEALFYLLNAPLIKFSMQYVNSRPIAEDIVIDVFLKCWLKRADLGTVSNPKTYLYVAVRNMSLNHVKKYSTTLFVGLDHTDRFELIDVADPQVLLEKKELIKRLDDTIDSLPQQCKLVFKLIKNDGLKYLEVAELLEISPKTVQNHLFTAIAKLNNKLKDCLQYFKA
jgi:RNA polymerase sigma-70 factor (family 1)